VYVLGIIVIVRVLVFVILHLTGGGFAATEHILDVAP
jgi:hypothetical protein